MAGQRAVHTSTLPEIMGNGMVWYVLPRATVGEWILLCDDVNRQMVEGLVHQVEQHDAALCSARIIPRAETLGPWDNLRKMLWECRGPGLKAEFAPEKYRASCPEVVAGLHQGDQKEFQRRLKERGLRELGAAELNVRPPDPMAGHATDFSAMLRAAANV